jgi:hypothetical protein
MKVIDLGKQYSRRFRDEVFFKRFPKWLPSPLYAQKFNATWHKVYEPVLLQRQAPVNYGTLVVDLQRRLDNEFPEAGLLELNKVLLYGINGWVFSHEGYLLPDHSWYGRNVSEMRVPRLGLLPKSKRLRGVCLSLASDFAVGSYGHFLLDSISRLELFHKAGFKVSDVDYIFCPPPPFKNGTAPFRTIGYSQQKMYLEYRK